MSIRGIISTWLASMQSEPGGVSTFYDEGDAVGQNQGTLKPLPSHHSIICQVNLTVMMM